LLDAVEHEAAVSIEIFGSGIDLGFDSRQRISPAIIPAVQYTARAGAGASTAPRRPGGGIERPQPGVAALLAVAASGVNGYTRGTFIRAGLGRACAGFRRTL
jgi:hypothetical protein